MVVFQHLFVERKRERERERKRALSDEDKETVIIRGNRKVLHRRNRTKDAQKKEKRRER
jgi:hypothetical protein